MTTAKIVSISPPVIPIDNETHAMLDYADSAEARAKFEHARQELRDGKGIDPTPKYFADLNQRISNRAKDGDRTKGA
jgi:hypothetical protein